MKTTLNKAIVLSIGICCILVSIMGEASTNSSNLQTCKDELADLSFSPLTTTDDNTYVSIKYQDEDLDVQCIYNKHVAPGTVSLPSSVVLIHHHTPPSSYNCLAYGSFGLLTWTPGDIDDGNMECDTTDQITPLASYKDDNSNITIIS